MPCESTVLKEGGNDTSDRKEAFDFLVKLDVDGMMGGSSRTGSDLAGTGDVDGVVE